MIPKRWLYLLASLILSVSLAFVLRDFIYESVIVPLAYLWWVAGLYYRLVPQILLWVIFVFIILISVVRGLLMEIPIRTKRIIRRQPVQGQVEVLSKFVNKRKRGNYYKWLIANRLGKIARELLDQRDGRFAVKRFEQLTGRDWNPPIEVATYLDIGLNGSFADFPQQSKFIPQPTPLDMGTNEVVEYLEFEMENNRNGHRQGFGSQQ